MECTLATLIACFSGLYVSGGVEYRDVNYLEARIINEHEYTIVSESRNPFGKVAIGLQVPLSRTSFAEFELRHESSIVVGNDRGENSATLSVRWFPFR